MKIAIIHPFQFRFARGIERYVHNLTEQLAQRGHEIHLLTWRWPNAITWGIPHPNIHTHYLPYIRYYTSYFAVPFYIYHLLRRRFDWTLLYFGGYGIAEGLSLARRLRSQRYGIVFHFPHELTPHRYKEFKRWGLAQNADSLIAVSQYVAEGVEAQYGRHCGVISNGINLKAFQPSTEARDIIRKKLGVNPDAPVLITLAALEERKGIQWIIRALPGLASKFPDIEYWVLGEGPDRTTIEAEIADAGVGNHVRLLGQTEDVVSYLAAADIGCLLSFGESFGIAVLEYMAMQLPVVTSQHPPFPGFIHPEWGVTVDEQNTEVLSHELASLLSDSSRRRVMGMAGRHQILQKHTWSQVADEYSRSLSVEPTRIAEST